MFLALVDLAAYYRKLKNCVNRPKDGFYI